MAKDKKVDKNEKKRRTWLFIKITSFILLSIFLYFWSIGIIRTFIQYIQSSDALMGVPRAFFYFLSSFLSGIFIIAIFMKHFTKHYLYCHELTHALFGLLTGSSISKLKVSKDSASVNVSRPNLVVFLAPYIISLHAILALFLYGCVIIAFPKSGNAIHYLFTILIGLASAFHFIFTIKSLLQEQTDIERSGFFISYLSITAFNLAGAMTIITCIDEISFSYFIKSSLSYTFDTIAKLWVTAFSLF